MLSPSGAVKNSGKIVITFTRSGARGVGSSTAGAASVIEQSSGWIDPNDPFRAIDVRDDPIIWNQYRIVRAFNVERKALRELVGVRDHTHRFARLELDAHSRSSCTYT
jgi:hypothetical protein